jgi:ribosomal protein L19
MLIIFSNEITVEVAFYTKIENKEIFAKTLFSLVVYIFFNQVRENSFSIRESAGRIHMDYHIKINSPLLKRINILTLP